MVDYDSAVDCAQTYFINTHLIKCYKLANGIHANTVKTFTFVMELLDEKMHVLPMFSDDIENYY